MSRAVEPRRGLVLGAGGVLGAAWMVGALCALEDAVGLDVRSCEQIVGTSAGSVVAAMIGAGVTPSQLRDHQLGRMVDGPLAGFPWDYDRATGGALPPRPRLAFGSTALVRTNVRRLRRPPPTPGASGVGALGPGLLR